jgi:hypothetical protein
MQNLITLHSEFLREIDKQKNKKINDEAFIHAILSMKGMHKN